MDLGSWKIYHSKQQLYENIKNRHKGYMRSRSRLCIGLHFRHYIQSNMQPIALSEIRRQIKILCSQYRVNVHTLVNGDITCYVMKDNNAIGSIELMFNKDKDYYEVDWAKVEGKLVGKGKLLYYIGLYEAWPHFVGPGPRTNADAFRVWKTMESIEGLQSKTMNGKIYFRLSEKIS